MDFGTRSVLYGNRRYFKVSKYLTIKLMQLLFHLALFAALVVFKKNFKGVTIYLLVVISFILTLHVLTVRVANYFRQNRFRILKMELVNAGISLVLSLLSVFYAFYSEEHAIPTKLVINTYHPSTPDKAVSIVLFSLSLLQIVLALIKVLLNDDLVEYYDQAWIQQFIRCFRNFLPSSMTVKREPPMNYGILNFRWGRNREYTD